MIIFWGADLVHMQLLSKFNEIIRFVLFAIDIFIKYALVCFFKT